MNRFPLIFLFGLLTSVALHAADKRPNILYIMTDQHFAEALSCRMGSQYLKTPALDSIAAHGMFFTRAYVANPICMPSRNAIFTGRYPHEIGVTANIQATLDPEKFPNLGTYLRKAGYETAYAGKWHLCFNEKSVDTHGFETLKGKGLDAEIAENVVQFIKQKHDKPFLVVASFVNPHNICEYARGEPLNNGSVGTPPPPEQLPPAPANLLPPKNEPDTMTMMRKSYHATETFPVGNFTPQKWRELRWAYYRLIEKVDAEIGKVLAALRQAGLEENTLIIFTADHGECAGAHGFNQKTVFYEEAARVPLIVSLKGTTKPGTTDKFVNTGIDILPTMLEFCGLAKPQQLPGLSLRNLALGQSVSQWRDYVVVGNNMVQGGPVGLLRPATEGRMLRTERYKYSVFMFGNQRESLIDLQKDPGESIDLATDPAFKNVLLEHRDLLRRFATQHNDPLVAELLADDIKARPFTTEGVQIPRGKNKKKRESQVIMRALSLGIALLSLACHFVQPALGADGLFDAGMMWSRGQAVGKGPVRFTHSPMRPEDILHIVPYGLMVGGHVCPIDHGYFYPKPVAAGQEHYDVLAPADGFIVVVGHRVQMTGSSEQGRSYDDYALTIEHSGTIYTQYDLLTKLDPLVLDKLDTSVRERFAQKSMGPPVHTRIAVKAGQVVGKVGGRSLDFGVVNTEVRLPGFLTPKLYGHYAWRIHIVDPFDFFDEPLKGKLLALNVRKIKPYFGKIDYDLDGKLVGNWFLEGSGGYPGDRRDPRGYWMGHLAFAYHHIETNRIVVSIGDFEGKPRQWWVKGNSPDPATASEKSGMVKYELIWGQLGSDGRKQVRQDADEAQGVALAQVLPGRKLKFEAFPGKKAAEVTGFTSAAKLYER